MVEVDWRTRLDGDTYLGKAAAANPWSHHTNAWSHTLSFLFREYYVPRADIIVEILAGVVTALSVLPEVVAFALVAGINPERAIQTAMIMCPIATVFGGRPGMVTAAAGAVAVISKTVRRVRV